MSLSLSLRPCNDTPARGTKNPKTKPKPHSCILIFGVAVLPVAGHGVDMLWCCPVYVQPRLPLALWGFFDLAQGQGRAGQVSWITTRKQKKKKGQKKWGSRHTAAPGLAAVGATQLAPLHAGIRARSTAPQAGPGWMEGGRNAKRKFWIRCRYRPYRCGAWYSRIAWLCRPVVYADAARRPSYEPPAPPARGRGRGCVVL